MMKNLHPAKGFTLVETLVAIAIIMIAMIGPFVAVQDALSASYIARDELIGNSLAQEGVEYVRSVRDSNYLYTRNNSGNARAFLYGLNGTGGPSCIGMSVSNGSVCTIDPLLGSPSVALCTNPTNANPSGCNPLYITPANSATPYIYTQSTSGGAIQSRFTRYIQICYMNGTNCTAVLSNEARVTVTVSWQTQNQPYTTTVVDYLQNWLI